MDSVGSEPIASQGFLLVIKCWGVVAPKTRLVGVVWHKHWNKVDEHQRVNNGVDDINCDLRRKLDYAPEVIAIIMAIR